MDFKLLFEDFFSNPDRFVMVTTNCLTGKAEYFEEKKSSKRVMDIVSKEVCESILEYAFARPSAIEATLATALESEFSDIHHINRASDRDNEFVGRRIVEML